MSGVVAAAGLVLEAAGDGDIDALLAVERLCYTHPWTRRHFQDALARVEQARVLVLRAPGATGDAWRGIRAYCVVGWAGGQLEVHNLAVHPGERRRGLGRWLLVRALGLGRRHGAREAFLEVRASNQPARRLYRVCGFRELRVRRRYYQEPIEDAVVLGRALDGSEQY